MPNNKRDIKTAIEKDHYRIVYWVMIVVGAILIIINLGGAIAALVGVVLLYFGLKYAGYIND